MKKPPLIASLAAALAGLLVFDLSLPGAPSAASPSLPAPPRATNAVSRLPRTASATNPAAAQARSGGRAGPAAKAAIDAARARFRPGQATNPFPRAPGPGLGAASRATNAPAKGPRSAAKAKTGPVPAPAAPATARTGSKILETLRHWRASPSFYSLLSTGLFALLLGIMLLVRFLKSRKAAAVPQGAPVSMAALMARRKAAAAVHSCNVLELGPQGRHLWHFNARGGGFVLNREQDLAAGQRLPSGLIARDWRSLFQRKLNIAWLPAEHVFLRVAQFPASEYPELLSMVELQLEKLSPMPVNQIVWSLYVLPRIHGNQQTVIVLMAARNAVEEFLGQLEGQGFLADRLELPSLDQLQATNITANGAWIYPHTGGLKNTALAAWWYDGVLRNLDLITLPATNRPDGLREQLVQIAWAGEMEGWVTKPPTWHLVADAPTAADWEPALRAGLEQTVEVSPPLPPLQMAALTATRATQAEPQANLLPVEFAARYQQQFVDRLWMGGLGAVVGLYVIGVAIYLVALEVALIRTRSVEQSVAEVAPAYTNALTAQARCQVLQDRQELKYAALDCWKAIAEVLPASLTLDGFNFSDGKHLSLSGTAPADDQQDLLQFVGNLRKYLKDGQPLFDARTGDMPNMSRAGPNGQTLNWNVIFELKRVEAQ
jgi:hypothetical protein